MWGALRRIVDERRIDIVHAHDYKTNFYAWLLSRATAIVPMTTLHGYTGHSWKERVYYAVDRRLVKAFPRIVTVSAELAGEVIRLGAAPERVATILNGIDDAAFKRRPGHAARVRQALNLEPDDFVIGAVGRLERQKRFDLLIEAFDTLRRAHPARALKLVIAGEGSLRAALSAELERLNLSDCCRMAGQVDDVANLHHAFDMFVQSSDYEGTPNAVLEAMAMETPIVATDVGGTAELVRHGIEAIIVPPAQPRQLAAAMSQVLSDHSAAARRVATARGRVEGELSFRTRMKKLERVYDALMDEHRTRRQASAPQEPPASSPA